MAALGVWRERQYVGEVVREKGRLSLRYDDEYKGHPLSLSLPISAPYSSHNAIHNYLDGLLPDSDFVRSRWGKEFGVKPTSVFDLVRAVGSDVSGAFSFLPAGEEPVVGGIIPMTDDDVAERIRILSLDSSRWLPAGDAGQFSLAGAQAKFALHRLSDGRWGKPWGMQPSTHIFKPGINRDFDALDVIEHISMETARKVGVPVPLSSVMTFGSRRAFVTARYDRLRRPDGSVARIHQEDFCQALGIAPEKKYSSKGGPTAADLLKLIHENSLNVESDESFFVRALAVNVALRGTDAHAKNYAFLHTDAGVRLAPAYDIVSFLPYAEGTQLRGLKSAMGIGGQSRFTEIGEANWVNLAQSAGVDPDKVLGEVRSVLEAVPDALAGAIGEEAAAALDPETVKLWQGRTTYCSKMSLVAAG